MFNCTCSAAYATCCDDGLVRVWALPSHTQLLEFETTAGAGSSGTENAHAGSGGGGGGGEVDTGDVPSCCAWHPERPHVAVGYSGGALRLLDCSGGGGVLAEHCQHRGGVVALGFAAGGALLATAGLCVCVPRVRAGVCVCGLWVCAHVHVCFCARRSEWKMVWGAAGLLLEPKPTTRQVD